MVRRLKVFAFLCSALSSGVLLAAILVAVVEVWTYVPPIGAYTPISTKRSVDIYLDAKNTPRESLVCENLARRADRSDDFADRIIVSYRRLTNNLMLFLLLNSVLATAAFAYVGFKLRGMAANSSHAPSDKP